MIDSFDYGAGAVVAPNGAKRHQIASNASRPGGPLVSRRVRGQCGRVTPGWAGLSQDTDAFATTGRGLWIDVVGNRENQRRELGVLGHRHREDPPRLCF